MRFLLKYHASTPVLRYFCRRDCQFSVVFLKFRNAEDNFFVKQQTLETIELDLVRSNLFKIADAPVSLFHAFASINFEQLLVESTKTLQASR